MTILSVSHMAAAFGIMGNIVSFFVYLAPLPTFYRIYKKKSTEGFQSIPYAVALFSAMLLLYYCLLKTHGLMIITINCIGCAIEITYLILFLIYATKEAKAYTTKLLIFFNVGAYALIVLGTSLLSKGHQRLTIVGWICAAFSVSVFAAPLSAMRLVIKTKSVEYMPFPLSFFLTLCAVIWFFYGFLIKDYFIATPNVLGLMFAIAQMALYIIYKDKNKQVLPEDKETEIIGLSALDQNSKQLPEQLNLMAAAKLIIILTIMVAILTTTTKPLVAASPVGGRKLIVAGGGGRGGGGSESVSLSKSTPTRPPGPSPCTYTPGPPGSKPGSHC